MDQPPAVDWLLSSDEPAIRFLTRRDLLGNVAEEGIHEILSGPKVAALLAGQRPDGGFGSDPYRKWTGAHWRVISLAELAVPGFDPRVAAAADHVLNWLMRQGRHRRGPTVVDGLPRAHVCVDGNAVAACCLLGFAGDDRVRSIVESLLAWQWPDGGWNSDNKASGRRSSFHETLPAAWGLSEYARATGESAARAAAAQAAELFLEHGILYRLGTDEMIDHRWTQLRYPSYWHYDMLGALRLLTRLGLIDDPRANDALDRLEKRRLPDGRWAANTQWWKPPGSGGTEDVVDWGPAGQPNEMITLNALRVLLAAHRLSTARVVAPS